MRNPGKNPVGGILKYFGVAMCWGMAWLWSASQCVSVVYRGRCYDMYIHRGCASFEYEFAAAGGPPSGWKLQSKRAHRAVTLEAGIPPAGRLRDLGFVLPDWHERVGPVWGPMASAPVMVRGGLVTIPLWLVFFASATTVVVLRSWIRDPPPGSCTQCGYNLTGNVSGRCPECGVAVTPARDERLGRRRVPLPRRVAVVYWGIVLVLALPAALEFYSVALCTVPNGAGDYAIGFAVGSLLISPYTAFVGCVIHWTVKRWSLCGVLKTGL